MRREWIEIVMSLNFSALSFCLPPCGGSGLKFIYLHFPEIVYTVSLHAEGVD